MQTDTPDSEQHLKRVRRICLSMPGCTEKLSHGEPTFFAGKKVFVMFANNHHGDGHLAAWVAAPPGLQAALIQASPKKYFKPPYVGVRGWIGVELSRVDDDELAAHVLEAWKMIAPQKLKSGGSPREATGSPITPRSRR